MGFISCVFPETETDGSSHYMNTLCFRNISEFYGNFNITGYLTFYRFHSQPNSDLSDEFTLPAQSWEPLRNQYSPNVTQKIKLIKLISKQHNFIIVTKILTTTDSEKESKTNSISDSESHHQLLNSANSCISIFNVV